MDWMHIFKVNKRAEDSGVTLDDIQAAVNSYDPAVHEAPIVLGHPKTDAPAYGWIESLKLSGKTLLSKPKQVVQEFAEWIDKGYYKKISASFYGKNNPDNPTPGKLYLKHVGYLGANPPKIKGLPDHVFEESDGEIVTVEFSEVDFEDYGDNVNASMWRLFREWLIETQSLDLADRIVPVYKIDTLIEMSLRESPNDQIFERLDRLEERVFEGDPLKYSEQPRHPAGGPQGGQFAAKKGGAADSPFASFFGGQSPEEIFSAKTQRTEKTVNSGKPSDVPGFSTTKVQSKGEFISAEDEYLPNAGRVEIAAITKHTDPESGSDQYFAVASRDTYTALPAEHLQAAIALHADHVAKRGSNDWLEVPGTNLMLNSDASAEEFFTLNTLEEYRRSTDFTEATMKTIEEREDALEQRGAAIAKQEADLRRKERALEFSEAIEGLVKEGKVLAANKANHLKQLQLLDAVPQETLANFSEDGKEYNPVQEYLDSLRNSPKTVEFGEVTGEDPPEPSSDPVAIAQGIASEQLKAKAAGREISFAEAAYNYKNGAGN